MTPTQTTPPASPASPVPTAGPTKEAMQAAWAMHPDEYDDHENFWRTKHAEVIDRETHLPELLAIKEAAAAALRAHDDWWEHGGAHDKPSYIVAVNNLRQSLTAHDRAAGKEQP